jgi:hypothetical protein
MVKNGKTGENKLRMRIKQGTPTTLLSELVDFKDTRSVVPAGCPIDLNTNTTDFTLDVWFEKTGSSGWSMTGVELDFKANPRNNDWSLGELVVKRVELKGTFTKNKTDGWDKTFVIQGTVNFGATPVIVEASMQKDDISLKLLTPVGASDVVGKFVSGGLNNSSLSAPMLAQDTGVSDYRTKPFAQASVVFKKSDSNSYKPDSVSIRVGAGSGYKWQMVNPTLALKDPYAQLALKNLSKTTTLEVGLHGTLAFTQQKDKTIATIAIELIATLKELDLTLKAKDQGCTFGNLLYVVTAGEWDILPGFGPSLIELKFNINWDKKTASFSGTTADWTLPQGLSKLASMKKPTLSVTLNRGSGGMKPKGMLDGKATLLPDSGVEVQIPISYELPKGPVRIFGLDVKKIYEMAKRLYQLLKDAKLAAEVVAEVASAAGEAAVAAETIADAVSAPPPRSNKILYVGR